MAGLSQNGYYDMPCLKTKGIDITLFRNVRVFETII